LPRSLLSVKDLAAEVIIVDTGSKDETVRIAREFGAKVYSFSWCDDFSAARNYSLEQASGQWILWLDADEVLAEDALQILSPLLHRPDLEGIRINMVNFLGNSAGGDKETYLFLKLFRNRPNYRFVRRIHEQLLGVPEEAIKNCPNVNCYHYGYLNLVKESKQKGQRNLTILEQETTEKPDNFSWFNLGVEYLGEGRFHESANCLEKSLVNLPPNLIWSPKVYKALATCYIQLSQFNQAAEVCRAGLELYPAYTDLCYLQALALKEQSMLPQAVGLFHRCLAMPQTTSFMSEESYHGYRVWVALGQCYLALGKFPQALQSYIEAFSLNPENIGILAEMVGSLAKVIPLEQLADSMEKALAARGGDSALLVARVLTKTGFYEQGLAYLDGFSPSNPELRNSLTYLKAICLALLGRVADAAALITDLKGSQARGLKQFTAWFEHNRLAFFTADECVETAVLFWLRGLQLLKEGTNQFGPEVFTEAAEAFNKGVAIFEK